MIEQLLSNLKYDSLGPPGVEFLGEVGVADLINGETLATAIELTAGTALDPDSPWLHFILDGKTLYVAKKPYRSHVNWNQINAVGAVFGTKTVEINGLVYKVRLLKSAASGEVYTGGGGGYDRVETYGSEWNRLMYSVHSGNHTDTSNPSPVSGEGIRLGTLAQYADADLLVHRDAGNGTYSWCQETLSSNAGMRVYRGGLGISRLLWTTVSNAGPANGWRPVLELVP